MRPTFFQESGNIKCIGPIVVHVEYILEDEQGMLFSYNRFEKKLTGMRSVQNRH